jgi:hypothetical protein
LKYILTRFGLFWFHLVSVKDPKQKFIFSTNKPKYDQTSFMFWFVLVSTETKDKCSAGQLTTKYQRGIAQKDPMEKRKTEV